MSDRICKAIEKFEDKGFIVTAGDYNEYCCEKEGFKDIAFIPANVGTGVMFRVGKVLTKSMENALRLAKVN